MYFQSYIIIELINSLYMDDKGNKNNSTSINQEFDYKNESDIFQSSGEEIDFKSIFKVFLRRRKIILFSSLFIFLLGLTNLAYKNTFKKLYEGSFTMMISDPMEEKNSRRRFSTQGASLFEDIARNSRNVDLPTLIEYLKSEELLKETAKKYKLSPSSIGRRINIKVGSKKEKRRFDRAEGILTVKIISRKPKKDINLLIDISKTYLKASQDLRQKRLTDGLNFLNEQEPILQEKKENLYRWSLTRF